MEPSDARDSRSSDDVFSTPPEQTHPHRSKLYSPESPSPARRRPYSAEGPSMYMHINPPIRRGSPLNPQRSSGQDRWRPSSTDGPSPAPEALFRVRRSPLLMPVDDHLQQNVRNIPELDAGMNEASAFSDEYDLYPRILQDVHRALKVKAKREAKMKTAQSSSDHHTPLPANIPSSPKSPKSPGRQPYPHLASPTPLSPSSSPLRKTSTHTSSDIDFSPSTRRSPAQSYQHPVPASLDNGLTLDWGCSSFDEEKAERKWSISVRRRYKDKFPPLELMQDQQEKNHRERLSKLRASASSQTLRKAAMTSDQLHRRYGLMQEFSENQPVPFNLAMISRWYGSQRENRRQELENVEPLTWLKHLPRRTPHLSRWHLSARIMEEFVAAQRGSRQLQPQYMESIPEDDSLQPTSHPQTQEHSPERQRDFEARFQSPRSSLDVESRRSGESAPSSIISGSSNRVVSPVPPLGYYSQPKPWTSPRPENTDSGTEDFVRPHTTVRTILSTPPNGRASPSNLGDTQNEAVINLGDNLPKLVLPLPDVDEEKYDQVLESRPSPSPSAGAKSRSNADLLAVNWRFMSPPLSRHPPPSQHQPEDSHKEIQDEEGLRKEYEQKAALLENARVHNQRIRHLLNRISNSVREYDAAQRTATNLLGNKHQALPNELAESFGHDPAAVTGATRRLKGWRAVEDIHQRLERQREVFAAFIQTESHRSSDHDSMLDGQISSLMRSLSTLEEQKVILDERTKEAEWMLRDVRKVHIEAKGAYNKAVSLTSALYPEISQAVALEESYKDQYQQFWEFGMDALTLILDTVTPFWRNYGKIIGEDIRDFLIVPLYRNEFTGESKRYSLGTLPRRSPYHWLGLGLFFLTTVLLTTLQTRVAISSTVHSRLQWISIDGMRYTALPFFWFGILMQWCLVVLEFGVTLMELGVIVWWLGWSVNLLT